MMQASNSWPRFEEPFRRTLTRNATLAGLVSAAVALFRHDATGLLPVAILALWPSLGGHYVEVAFLNGVRPRIAPGRVTHAVVRLLMWCGGGALLYACMSVTASALPVTPLPLRLWWYGSIGFVAVELVVHATLAMRRLASFYDGRG